MEASSSFVHKLDHYNRAGRLALEVWLVLAGAAHQSCSSLVVSGTFLPSDDPVFLWQQLGLPRDVLKFSCGREWGEEQEKYGIRSDNRFWQ